MEMSLSEILAQLLAEGGPLSRGDPRAVEALRGRGPSMDPRYQSRPPLPMRTAPAWRSALGRMPSRPQSAPTPQDSVPLVGAILPPAPWEGPPAATVGLPRESRDMPSAYADAGDYLAAPYLLPRPRIGAAIDRGDQTAWRQPEQIGAVPSVAENRLPIGAPALDRGLEPPSAPADDDDPDEVAWRAALARTRARMQKDPTGLRRERDGALREYRDRAARDRLIAGAMTLLPR